MSKMNLVFFLGAGASRTDRAPLQNELLDLYFSDPKINYPDFDQFFFDNFTGNNLPSLEEVFGLIHFNWKDPHNVDNKDYYEYLKNTLSLIIFEVIKKN